MAGIFKVHRPVRVSKTKTYQSDYEGEMPELTGGDVEALEKRGAISVLETGAPDASKSNAPELTEEETKATAEERAELIKVAVAEAMDADPDRDKQPIIKTIEAILEFKDVKADEITVAYEAIKAETPSNDNGGNTPAANNT